MQTGYIDLAVAGGTESMSNAPYLLKGARWGYRMGHAEVSDSILAEGLTCAIEGCHMGMTAETIVERFGISRADQDAFAAESQRRAEEAITGGNSRTRSFPSRSRRKGRADVFDTDEHPRRGTTIEKLAALKPAFKKDGSVTAGNASGINDGAAAVVVDQRRARPAARTNAAGAGRLVRVDRYRSRDHGDGTGERSPQSARSAPGSRSQTSICSN